MSIPALIGIDFNKIAATNFSIESLSGAPSSPVLGQLYFNTGTGKLYVCTHAGTPTWEELNTGGDEHTHSNKSYLDTINQNMGTSHSPNFTGLTVSGMLGMRRYLSSTTGYTRGGRQVIDFNSQSYNDGITYSSGSFTLTPGTWSIAASVSPDTFVSGDYMFLCLTNTSNSEIERIAGARPYGTDNFTLNAHTIVRVSSSTTYQLRIWFYGTGTSNLIGGSSRTFMQIQKLIDP